MLEHIEEYIASQRLAWSDTTLKSESSRLLCIPASLRSPREVYDYLVAQGRAPYSIKTTFIRLAKMEQWALSRGKIGDDPYRVFIMEHRRLFKHAYQRIPVNVTFDEALVLIKRLPEDCQQQALTLLNTGLRISEIYKIQKDEDGYYVIGKGGKRRKIYGKINMTGPVAKARFRAELHKVGLVPHDLRKLAATRLAERGALPQDLCEVFGWSKIETAYYYLQPQREDKLRAFVEESLGEGTDLSMRKV